MINLVFSCYSFPYCDIEYKKRRKYGAPRAAGQYLAEYSKQ
jgi:hypothetical protein